MSTLRVSRIQLVCADVNATAGFYEAAFGFERIGEIDAGRVVTLRLGNQSIELVDIQPRGRRYPDGVSGANFLFQHFAIVVGDMPSAYRHLRTQGGWMAISTDGPQQLPAVSGRVTAFKFRDPEGHPLELLAFPDRSRPGRWQALSASPFLGIDHSALSVADTARSIAFYEDLGLAVSHRSLNVGPEQDRLDGMTAVQVEVTAMASPDSPTPHVEFLCYSGSHPVWTRPAPNDIAATRLVFVVDKSEELKALCGRWLRALVAAPWKLDDRCLYALLRDPDDHLILLESSLL